MVEITNQLQLQQVALKAVPKATTTLKDFLLEFHYSYFLSPHHNILDTYDVAFETYDHYYFAQEIAPFGDLAQVNIFGISNYYYLSSHLFIKKKIRVCCCVLVSFLIISLFFLPHLPF